MSIEIARIKDEKYRKLADKIDKDSSNGGNSDLFLDDKEISIFVNKVNTELGNENGKKITTLQDFATLLGLEIKQGKNPHSSREDYNLVRDLKESIYRRGWFGIPFWSDDDKTIELLKKITKENVVYILKEYKQLTEEDLAKDVDDDGIDIKTIKETICSKLDARAKELKLNVKPYNSNDIEDIISWINDVSEKIEKVNTFSITVEKGQKNIQQYVHFGEDETAIEELHYNDGRIVLAQHGQSTNGTVRSLVSSNNTGFMADRTRKPNEKAKTLYVYNTEDGYISDMAKTLKENKAKLMEELNINNETYDRYARMVLAIADYEVNENTGKRYYFWASIQRKGKKCISSDHLSEGYTALKFEDIVDIAKKDTKNKEYQKFQKYFKESPELVDELVKKYQNLLAKMKKYGIESSEDLYDSEKSAIATMLFIDARLNMLEFICKNDKNPTRTRTQNQDLQSRVYASSPNPTEEGLIAKLYSGGFDAIIDGTFNENDESAKYETGVKALYKKYSGKTN